MTAGVLLKLVWLAAGGWPVACAGLCVLGLLLYWELTHGRTLRRAYRMAATVIAVAALCLLALKPAWQTGIVNKHWILVTAGASPAQIDSVARNYTEPILTYYVDSMGIDLSTLRAKLGSPQTLTLIGSGLPQYTWQQLDGLQVQYVPAEKSSGIVALHSPQQLQASAAWQISGRYVNDLKEQVLLRLETMGGSVADSVTVPAHAERPFTLRLTPRHGGGQQALLRASTVRGKQIDKNSLYTYVQPKRSLRLLVLTAAPSFETNYFKNWAGSEGHTVTVRTGVSRGIYKYQWINAAQNPILALSPAALQAYDWVWLDAETLNGLTVQEYGALRDALLQGLGVWVGLDETTQGTPALNPRLAAWQTAPLVTDSAALLPVRWVYGEAEVQAVLPPVNMQVTCTGMQQPLMQTQSQIPATVAAYGQQGAGVWGVHTPLRTYTWVLNGQQEAYNRYWAAVLNKLARPAPLALAPDAQNLQVVYVNEPVHLRSLDAGVNTVVVTAPGGTRHTLHPLQGTPYRARNHYTFWPRVAGWHHAVVRKGTDASEAWLYVRKPSEDATLAALERTQLAQLNARMHTKQAQTPNAMPATPDTTPLSVWWFWAAFLLSAGYLWLERKL